LLLLQYKREKRGRWWCCCIRARVWSPTNLSSISDHQPKLQSKAQATILCWLTVMPRLLHVSSVSSGEHKPSPRVLLLVCVCVCFFLGVLLFLGLSSRERLQTHHYVSLLLLLLLLLLAGFLFWLTFVVHGFELFSFLFCVLMRCGVFFFFLGPLPS
jgi:hypothetical protein